MDCDYGLERRIKKLLEVLSFIVVLYSLILFTTLFGMVETLISRKADGCMILPFVTRFLSVLASSLVSSHFLFK